jgi:hypothetical protein
VKHPLDKWSRNYNDLLTLQTAQLVQWAKVLRPEVYADLEEYCRQTNRPCPAEEMEARQSLRVYKAGGIHICPVGFELYQVLVDRQRFDESIQYVISSSEGLLKTLRNPKTKIDTMKEVNKKLGEVLVLLASIVSVLGAEAPSAAPAPEEPSGPTLKSLAALAGKKDPKLAAKVLAKFGAELEDGKISDLDEKDFEKAQSKLEALDDAEGGGDEEKPKGKATGKVDLEKLRAVAQELITAGKSSGIKKVLSKFDAESLSKLDEKHYDAVHAKLTELAD